MIAFICYFFPAIIAISIYESLTGNKLGLKEMVFRFCKNTLLINFICFAVKKFVFKTATQPIYYVSEDMTPSVAFNYIIIAVAASVVITVCEVLISKKVKITVEENLNEED